MRCDGSRPKRRHRTDNNTPAPLHVRRCSAIATTNLNHSDCCSIRLLADAPPAVGHSFEFDSASALPYHVLTACIEPSCKILALADVEDLEISAAFNYSLDACACHADTAAYGEVAELEQME